MGVSDGSEQHIEIRKVLAHSQEEVQPPAGRVSGNIGANAAIESLPPVAGLDVLERGPYGAPHPTLRLFGCYLELDFEEVKWVHTQYRDDPCAEPREGMILAEGELGQARQSEGREEHTQAPRWGRSSVGVDAFGTCAARCWERAEERGGAGERRGDEVRLGVPCGCGVDAEQDDCRANLERLNTEIRLGKQSALFSPRCLSSSPLALNSLDAAPHNIPPPPHLVPLDANALRPIDGVLVTPLPPCLTCNYRHPGQHFRRCPLPNSHADTMFLSQRSASPVWRAVEIDITPDSDPW